MISPNQISWPFLHCLNEIGWPVQPTAPAKVKYTYPPVNLAYTFVIAKVIDTVGENVGANVGDCVSLADINVKRTELLVASSV
jgi:hypothetical protein